jgi:hypothetical protein
MLLDSQRFDGSLEGTRSEILSETLGESESAGLDHTEATDLRGATLLGVARCRPWRVLAGWERGRTRVEWTRLGRAGDEENGTARRGLVKCRSVLA